MTICRVNDSDAPDSATKDISGYRSAVERRQLKSLPALDSSPMTFKIPFSINPKDSTFSRTQVVRIPASTFPLRTEEITSGV